MVYRRLLLLAPARLRFGAARLRFGAARLFEPPRAAARLRRPRLAEAALVAAFAAARLFLVRAAFFAAALLLAFDVAIILSSQFLMSYVLQVRCFCALHVPF